MSVDLDVDTGAGNEPQRWHVGKEIPVALIFAVFLQTMGGTWWLSQLSNKIDTAVARLDEFKAERYTKEDARRDKELAALTLTIVDRRLMTLEQTRK